MQKTKTFKRGMFGTHNAASRKAQSWANKHGYTITNLVLTFNGHQATATMVKNR